MQETLVVSSRGQITLPAVLRKRFGIKSGDVLILEDRGNEIVLKPGVALEIQYYSDEQIAEWDAADLLSDRERARILDKFKGLWCVHEPAGKNFRYSDPDGGQFSRSSLNPA